jgi:putative SOS response-associated peptidase YedK
MCGRYTLVTKREDLAKAFDLPLDAFPESLPPRYNIAPSEPMLVLLRDPEIRAAHVRWGLVPGWAKDPSIGNRLINARRETLATRGAFRDSFHERRCLVPADGFYEWLDAGARKPRVPHYVRRGDAQPFTFAGLWSSWRGPGGEELLSATIVTTDANHLVGRIHDRMPVIVRPADRAAWMDPSLHDARELGRLLEAPDAEELELYPVSRYVNNADHDGDLCIRPADEPPPELNLQN